MNKASDENESFDASDLTIAQPAIGDDLLVEVEQPAISGDLSVELEQPAISDDLTQQFIHLLMPPEENNNPETSR